MTVQILKGDCRSALKTLPNESVHCCVTSPPYWGLRDYGTGKWEGGDADCNHAGKRAVGASTLKNDGRTNPGILDNHKVPNVPYRDVCLDCGARRIDSQIGLESSPQEYVATMVGVFREVRRALRKDGTLWVNLGDSYASAPLGSFNGGGFKDKSAQTGGRDLSGVATSGRMNKLVGSGIKPKDLCGIPWRVAFALQADGWWLRQDIIWSKPNPMPESVTDRCTKAHECIFLLSKSEQYYYDAGAIAEDVVQSSISRWGQDIGRKNVSPGSIMAAEPVKGESTFGFGEKRNKRSVWEVATAPFSEAHFATFPPALIEPCIKAGCPKDGMVLDPFGGAGTTGLVADRLGRNAILIELNPEYANMAERRIRSDAGMFANISQSA